uniref:U2A'/phosphoprotein 32 family A C-terminal domain-containing protein n=1 Tax=Globisporangium ultimum (strain ATCC 200006 / CBS 805.95 / DAOM BR144) TaxID=431595 RepID=K3WAN5_GLOUD
MSAVEEETGAVSSPTTSLARAHVQPRLSVLGKNPFTHAHIYTTATLTNLRLLDLNALSEFPHIQHIHCNENAIESLAPLQHLPLLLSVDASNNHLSQVLDFDTPKCTYANAWVNGGKWIGSLLRRANLCSNRIERIRDLTNSHPFLQELYLAHNNIMTIEGVSQLRFLRVLDLSSNKLTSTRGLVSMRQPASEKKLDALEKLVLNNNQIRSVDEVVALPRLEHLDLAHNSMKELKSIGACGRLQHLDLTDNDVDDVNELNHLIPLQLLEKISLVGCPLVDLEGSHVFYRTRVLRRLSHIHQLDDDEVTAKEKVKALVMHGSDLETRQRVFAKHLPGQQFTNFLPPLEFEDDQELERLHA